MEGREKSTVQGVWRKSAAGLGLTRHTAALPSQPRRLLPLLVQPDGSDLYWALSTIS